MIGKEGQKLKNIELSTATKISIPRHDDPSDIIKIVGTKEGIDKAQHQIQMISDEQVCRVCVCVCVCVCFCMCVPYPTATCGDLTNLAFIKFSPVVNCLVIIGIRLSNVGNLILIG